MKTTLRKIILFFTFTLTLSQLLAQAPPPKAWDKSFGGASDDYLEQIVQTQDGGFLLAGYSASGAGSSKTSNPFGGNDFWVVKMKADGTKEWDKTYGGNRDDALMTMTATPDGGYLLGGFSDSGIGGSKTQASRGNYDYWVIKINKDGEKVWDKTFGTANYDYLESVTPTRDGGYLLGGSTAAGIDGDKTSNSKGALGYWVVKIDQNGNKVWDKTYGSSGDDIFTSIIPVASGGYLLAGTSLTGGGLDKSSASKGSGDYWIIKIDENGEKLWDRTFGGDGFNVLMATLEVPDGFLLAGHTDAGKSYDKTEASFGENDYWVVKIDQSGNKVWDKTFGGSLNEHVLTLVHTKDGAFMVGGHSYSGVSGLKSEAAKGDADFWIVKFNQEGQKIWDKTIGGANGDYLTSIISLADDNYLLGGMSLSRASGDKASINLGTADYWVVKLGQTDAPPSPSIPTSPTIPGGTNPFCMPSIFRIYPNPTTGIVRFSTSDECMTLPPFSLTIMNPIGQVLLHTDLLSSTDAVDISGLASGLYLLVLTFEDKQRITEKIVKVN